MYRANRLLAGICVLIGLSGIVPSAGQAGGPAARRGIVFVVGGVGGCDPLGGSAQWALPQVGINLEVQEIVWSHGGPGCILRDLQDFPYLLDRGRELANQVLQIKAIDPDRPVYLVGKSGGAE